MHNSLEVVRAYTSTSGSLKEERDMRKLLKRALHVYLFTYVMWWTLTRDFDYLLNYYFGGFLK